MAEREPTATDAQGNSAQPAVYEISLHVAAEDIDALNHANNIVYLRWVQEAATAHWFAAATEQQKAEFIWVVLRHEIDYLRPALLGDELIARTHVGEASGARFDRHVEIWRVSDNTLLARARSVWAAIDARTGRPRRVDAALRQRFYEPPNESGLSPC
jgi:acyl-CoA thioester hydrolase